MVSIVFGLLLIFGSIDYLFLRLQSKELSGKLAISTKKVNLLSDQIAKIDHDRYWIDTIEQEKQISAVRDEIIKQPEFSSKGIWITSKPTLSEEEYKEGRFVEIDSFRPSVKDDELKLTLKLKNTSNPPQVVGGYIIITLVNNDQSPPLYRSVPEGEIGDNGFPSSYNSGKPYNIKRRTSTKRLKFTLTSVNEYYTDAMIFLFSYRGRLLNKDQFALKKEIFLE